MELYFTQRKLVSHNFIPDERMIWIEIDGLPLNAWTTNAFKKIAGNWGETVFVDEDADENIANGRIPEAFEGEMIRIYIYKELQEKGKINDKKGGRANGYEINRPPGKSWTPLKKAESLVNQMMGV
ncbi:RNA-directed DNA polymerase, eukaryota [Tanacetum coccineum]